MGSAASVVVPEEIHFADLLALSPVFTQNAPDTSIDTNALRDLFKFHRNHEGFLTKDKFIELVLQFSQDAQLRESLVVHNDKITQEDEEGRLKEITEIHRFRDSPKYNQVHLMDYEVFKTSGSYPCFSNPVTASAHPAHHETKLRFQATTPADEVNFENSYVIFISHTWFRHEVAGSAAVTATVQQPAPTAMNVKGIPVELRVHIPVAEVAKDIHVNTHPDTEHNEQYKVCVSGLNKFISAHLSNYDKIYVWLDYSCLDLRPEHIDSTLSKLSLTTIMSCCDCIFTPVLDNDVTWEYPAEMVHFFEDYNPAPWNSGPAAYMNRAWCRMEMFYSNNVPLMPDLTPEDVTAFTARYHVALVDQKIPVLDKLTEVNDLFSGKQFVHKNPFSNVSAALLESRFLARRMRMSKRLRCRASSEQRPHVIYSSYEYRLGLPPIIVGALSNLYLDKYAPLAGYCSHLADLTAKPEVSAFSPTAVASRDGPSTAASKRSNGTTPSSSNSRSAVKLEVDYNKKSSVKMSTQKAPVSVLQRLMDELKILILKGKVGYDGEMNEDGERHGKGIYTYPNGEKYIGDWEHGRRHGCGYFQHSNGDVYSGEFHQDKERGLCTLRYANGDSFFGELHHGKKIGHGLVQYRNGDLYEGEFSRDMRHGEGVFKFIDGSVYAGKFKDDQRHGFGVLTGVTGKVEYHGMWKNNKPAPDFKPEEEEVDTETTDGDGHHHKHHHHHHHKHHHHHHHHHDGSDGEAEEGEEEKSHRKHHHKHSTEEETSSVSPSPSLPNLAAKGGAADPTAKEKMAEIKKLFASQSGAQVLTIAQIEAAHREEQRKEVHPAKGGKKKKSQSPREEVNDFAALPTKAAEAAHALKTASTDAAETAPAHKKGAKDGAHAGGAKHPHPAPHKKH